MIQIGILDDNGYWEATLKLDGEKYRADFQENGLMGGD